MPNTPHDYLAAIGKRGGEAGKGKAKRRSPEQYRAMAKKSAHVRRANKQQSRNSATEKRSESSG